MNKSKKVIISEIKQHSDKAIESFNQGQKIHRNYMNAPEEHNLADEIEQFTDKLQTGIDEIDKAQKTQEEYLDGKI